MHRPLKDGFTLAELLGSIAIIAISLATCLPTPAGLDELDGVVVDEGPVSVRHFLCAGEGDDVEIENQIRTALAATSFEFCGMAREVEGDDVVTVAIWAPIRLGDDVLLGDLRTHLDSLAIAHYVPLAERRQARVAMNG